MNPDHIPPLIRRLKQQLLNLKRFLDEAGYVFDFPGEAMPGVDPETESAICRISSGIGEIPRALLAFYREIGGVNFCGQHPDWSGCEYPDPLVIYPPGAALSELDEYLQDREEWDTWYGGFRIPLSPDFYHKAEVSGGMWYGIAVPAEDDNPIVLEESHQLPFLEYLQLNMHYGGFPGLENQSPGSTWPLDKLREAVNLE